MSGIALDAMPLPVIRTKNNVFRYQMTRADVLTLARSLRKEEKAGTNRDSIGRLAWCYAQRLVCYPSMAPFARMVTNHSQPINPAWFPDGTYCAPGGAYFGQQPCAAAPLRPGNAIYPWEAIDARTKQYLYDWLTGAIPNTIPRGTDFAAADLVARKIAGGKPWEIVFQGSATENSIVNEPCSRAWPSDDWVQLEWNGRIVSSTVGGGHGFLLGALVLTGFGFGGYAYWKRHGGRR